MDTDTMVFILLLTWLQYAKLEYKDSSKWITSSETTLAGKEWRSSCPPKILTRTTPAILALTIPGNLEKLYLKIIKELRLTKRKELSKIRYLLQIIYFRRMKVIRKELIPTKSKGFYNQLPPLKKLRIPLRLKRERKRKL